MTYTHINQTHVYAQWHKPRKQYQKIHNTCNYCSKKKSWAHILQLMMQFLSRYKDIKATEKTNRTIKLSCQKTHSPIESGFRQKHVDKHQCESQKAAEI